MATFRDLLPDDAVTHAWTDLTFTDLTFTDFTFTDFTITDLGGCSHEVDALLLTKVGLFVVQLDETAGLRIRQPPRALRGQRPFLASWTGECRTSSESPAVLG